MATMLSPLLRRPETRPMPPRGSFSLLRGTSFTIPITETTGVPSQGPRLRRALLSHSLPSIIWRMITRRMGVTMRNEDESTHLHDFSSSVVSEPLALSCPLPGKFGLSSWSSLIVEWLSDGRVWRGIMRRNCCFCFASHEWISNSRLHLCKMPG